MVGYVAGEHFLEPLWCDGAILSTQLIDMLESKQSNEIQESSDETDIYEPEIEALSSDENSDDEHGL